MRMYAINYQVTQEEIIDQRYLIQLIIHTRQNLLTIETQFSQRFFELLGFVQKL